MAPRLPSLSAAVKFEIVGPIDRVETIAKGRGIRDLSRLLAKHGKGIRFENGDRARAELHWYEAHGIGRRETRVKRIMKREP